MSEIGHNSNAVAADQLKSFIERIERVDEDLKGLREDRKEILAEAKGNGFDTRVVQKIVALRKRDHDEIAEEQAILELYCRALGLDFLL